MVNASVTVRTDEGATPGPKDELILATVLAQIEAVGYDAVELRTIAREARVSLATIYKSFPSRDALLLAAVEQWMGRNVYQPIPTPDPRSPVADRLCAVLHGIFEPWLDDPRMLEAFVRASDRGGGDELHAQGEAAVEPLIAACFDDDADERDVAEILEILTHVVQLGHDPLRERRDARRGVPARPGDDGAAPHRRHHTLTS